MKTQTIMRQGARADLASPKIPAKFRSDDEAGREAGVSGGTIRSPIVPILRTSAPVQLHAAPFHS